MKETMNVRFAPQVPSFGSGTVVNGAGIVLGGSAKEVPKVHSD